MDISKLQNKTISSLLDIITIARSSINYNKVTQKKKTFLDNYNNFLTKYMRILTSSNFNSDFAYYYLCIRYRIGMMDEDITLMDQNQMSIFAESLLDCMWKMGNKYAKALHDYEES